MDRFREIRIARKITLEEAANRLGVSGAFVSMVETGCKIPSWGQVKTLAEFYGVTPNDFIIAENNGEEKEGA